MALHDPVEDALNARKARARRVEAGDAFSPDDLDITKKFLGGEVGAPGQVPGSRQLPSQASGVARGRAFGQQGALRRDARPGAGVPVQPISTVPAAQPPLREPVGGSLSDRFFNLPSPVGFAQTSQGQALLRRILQLRGLR